MPRVKKEAVKETKTAKKAAKAPEKKVVKKVETAKKVEKKIVAKPVVEEKLAKKVEKTEVKETAKKAPKVKTGPKEDTGSVTFQIDNFSQKIKSLAKHLKAHAHDFDSRRGLLIMVGKRRRLLNYLKRQDEATYAKLIADLGLRK